MQDKRLPECECLEDVELSDGSVVGCSHGDFCLVRVSPCLALSEQFEGPSGAEASEPAPGLGELLHRSYLACSKPSQN